MSGSSTKTASAARTSMLAAAKELAMRATVRAGVSTIWAARGRRPTALLDLEFCDVGGGIWPVGIGHPCYGCNEQGWVSARDLPARQGGESPRG
jgi:hypothetical protein